MNNVKVGALLLQLRKEKGMTQKQVADLMLISDKAISKWERGFGCPDISLLSRLSDIFEVNIERILEGELQDNNMDNGNLKRIKFYVCPSCGNIINNTGNANISCCGRKLSPLIAKSTDEQHSLTVEEIEDEYYITFHHDMSKTHFISFVAYVTSDRILLVKLYPEQPATVRLSKIVCGKIGYKSSGKLYFYCTEHGLWVV